MKLTPLQKHRMEEAHRHASTVLRDIKQGRLSGADLQYMKQLEETVSQLELLSFVQATVKG